MGRKKLYGEDMVYKHFRLPKGLYEKAFEKARNEGTTISALLRRFLENYITTAEN